MLPASSARAAPECRAARLICLAHCTPSLYSSDAHSWLPVFGHGRRLPRGGLSTARRSSSCAPQEAYCPPLLPHLARQCVTPDPAREPLTGLHTSAVLEVLAGALINDGLLAGQRKRPPLGCPGCPLGGSVGACWSLLVEMKQVGGGPSAGARAMAPLADARPDSWLPRSPMTVS